MSEIVLKAQRRQPGRSNARLLRRQGIVPGIYYFHGEEPIAIAAHELALRPLIYTHESHIVRITLDDGLEKTAVIKDIVFDPITDRPVHFDMQGVAANEAITVEVPVMLTGHAIGQRDGGIVDWVLHKLEVECFPSDLPEHIEVDVTDLKVNESIHVRDINVPNAKILQAEDATIVAITPPRVSADMEAAPAVAAEPEVITKGKAETEE